MISICYGQSKLPLKIYLKSFRKDKSVTSLLKLKNEDEI